MWFSKRDKKAEQLAQEGADAYVQHLKLSHEVHVQSAALQRLLLEECLVHTKLYERIAVALEPKQVTKLKRKK